MLVFLDAHMEVTERWLEPLLAYIKNNPYSIAAAVVDPIEESGQYVSSPEVSLATFNRQTLNTQW